DYINDVTGPERLALLGELLGLDVDYRRKAGEQPAFGDYQFPDYTALIHAVFSQQKGESGQPTQSLADKQPAVAAGPQVATGFAPEPRPDVPGYEVLEEIGGGGMGVVWRVRDLRFQRLLAVKVLRSKYRGQPALEQRFREEAQITGQLQHPGI